MRLVKPMSMFTNSLIGHDSVFPPRVDGGRAWKLAPKLSGSPSYGVICGDGGVRWPKDAWAASTVTSWTGSSYVPGKARQSGNGGPCCDEEHSPHDSQNKHAGKLDPRPLRTGEHQK